MSRFISVLILILTVATNGGGAAAGETCFADWSVASPIVKKEGLVAVEQLTPTAKMRFNGDVVKVTLCEDNGVYIYRLIVKDSRGNLKTETVDAKNPF